MRGRLAARVPRKKDRSPHPDQTSRARARVDERSGPQTEEEGIIEGEVVRKGLTFASDVDSSPDSPLN